MSSGVLNNHKLENNKKSSKGIMREYRIDIIICIS